MARSIEFHTHLAEPVDYACRLLRKAMRQGVQVLCTAPAETLQLLDRALWTFEERDFVPHVRLPGAAPALAARTPIWLAEAPLADAGERVLVNLGAAWPVAQALALPHPRIVELVAAEPDEADAGRQRWRAYKLAGAEIAHRNASAASAAAGEA